MAVFLTKNDMDSGICTTVIFKNRLDLSVRWCVISYAQFPVRYIWFCTESSACRNKCGSGLYTGIRIEMSGGDCNPWICFLIADISCGVSFSNLSCHSKYPVPILLFHDSRRMVFIDSPSLYLLKTRFQQATIPPLFRIAQQIFHIGLIQHFFLILIWWNES